MGILVMVHWCFNKQTHTYPQNKILYSILFSDLLKQVQLLVYIVYSVAFLMNFILNYPYKSFLLFYQFTTCHELLLQTWQLVFYVNDDTMQLLFSQLRLLNMKSNSEPSALRAKTIEIIK